ncbi:MAG TPA: DUF4412 domain-containing protein [Thermoanaerobaculia bacterium]|jgi:hypothetical protein
MKTFVTALILVLAAISSFAGVTYKLDSKTTGLASANITGTVKVEGTGMRMELASGDGVLFKNGSILTTKNGGKNILVTDPSTKTYYELDLQHLGGAGPLLRQLGDSVKMTIENPKVTSRDAGDGGTIEGYATRKKVIDSSYDMVIEAMGQKMRMTTVTSSQLWVTDKLGADLVNIFQIRGFKTGLDEIDRLIEKQSAAVTGFPLKQLTTVKVVQNGNEMTSTTTINVSGLKETKLAPAEFELPAGFTKTESPIEKLLKQMPR